MAGSGGVCWPDRLASHCTRTRTCTSSVMLCRYIVAVSTFEPNQLAAFTLCLSSAQDPAAQLHPLQSRPLSASLTRPPAAASSSDAATAAAAPLVAGGDDGTGAAVLPAGAACGASVAQLDLERAQQAGDIGEIWGRYREI